MHEHVAERTESTELIKVQCRLANEECVTRLWDATHCETRFHDHQRDKRKNIQLICLQRLGVQHIYVQFAISMNAQFSRSSDYYSLLHKL